MAESIIYLARHGMHDLLLPGRNRMAGSLPGVRLNSQGVAQAQRIASRLAAEPIVWVACSPLERTHETAEIIARPHGCDVTVDERLLEWRSGPWEGMAISEIQQRYPMEWALWRERPEQLQMLPSGLGMKGKSVKYSTGLIQIILPLSFLLIPFESQRAMIRTTLPVSL